MKECKSTKLETLVVKQKNNGTIVYLMFIITYSRKPQVNDFHVVILYSAVPVGQFGAYSRAVNCTR